MKASIKKKLQISFTFIFLILAGTVCLFWRKAMSDMAEEKAISHFAVSVQAVNDEIDSLLKDASYISLILSFHAEEQSKILTGNKTIENYRQLESQRAITRSISDFYSYRNYISSILLVGENGNEFSNGVTLPMSELKKQDWFETLKEDDGSGVFIKTHSNYTGSSPYTTTVLSAGRRLFDKGEPIGYLLVDLSYDYVKNRLETISGDGGRSSPYTTTVLSAGRRLFDKGEPIGYLLVDLSYDYVKNRLETISGDGGNLIVFDADGGMVYDSTSPDFPKKSLKDTSFDGVRELISDTEGRFYFNKDGKEYLALYKTSDFTGWTSMFLIPKSLIMEDINAATRMILYISVLLLVVGALLIGYFSRYLTRNILKLKRYVDLIMEDINAATRMILYISVLLLVVGALLIGYFSRYLTRNILKLKRYVDQVEAEHLNEIPAIYSGDEIQELGTSFNQMICRIKQLMLDVEERQQRERNAQFQALYAQISPHFLSNTLNTIRWMADR